MVAGFGVWRSRPRSSGGVARIASAVALGVALASALAGCTGETLVVGGELPRDPDEQEPEGREANDAGAPGEITLVEDCPPSPEERRAAPGCWPPRHLGVWRGFFLGLPRYE